MKRLITVLLMLSVLGVSTPVILFAAGGADAVEQSAKVSLNAGTVADLQALPGIGKVTAERIVAFRKQNGPFTKVDDLLKVNGVGAKTLAKIRPMVVL
ncbi:MAG: helix-hairpin-helix domain-containing protein [Desulfuromonadales bacterium]|nr:helix-hairpin-helix domain-containing protein [Desulfuromonadales bacterium]